jgi:hypothetical protein
MEAQIRMISAASKVLSFRKQSPYAIDEDIFQYVSDYISEENVKDEKVKLAMIAASAEAFDISRKNPKFSEKDVLRELMGKIPGIIANLEEEG